jgi:hypothetical protein
LVARREAQELAPVHGPVPPVVPTEKIAHSNGRRMLHCGISTRLMTATGHFRQIDPLPTLSACPLCSDSTFAVLKLITKRVLVVPAMV